ncbi:MAG: S-methyl-5-thioribose-1-phosphate isomerase [Bacteroidales bacterium]|nr:S-methyl-5-thioribose-1-phosphate isomerase [Bacteroidales bacterium]
MKIGDLQYQSIWLDSNDDTSVRVIDQRLLPFELKIVSITSVEETFRAISNMTLRGAPLIGAAGAFGMYLATLEITSRTRIKEHLETAARYLISSRPTAVNLEWAVGRQLKFLTGLDSKKELIEKSRKLALEITEKEIDNCKLIGEQGLPLIEELSKHKAGETVNILTHCNAGWLACVDYGTATAPIYMAHDKGIKVHVWVDETRPRMQGARLTAYELGSHGVPHTLITDNAGGHLMQKGEVDMVIVGSDRTTARGDVANKIGTYLKALAARDNNIPFYAALPCSSIDRSISDGLEEIVVEERDEKEVTHIEGAYKDQVIELRLAPEATRASNFGFDITPARLITGIITEKGIIDASVQGISSLFTDK